ncbi:hypothetical protein ACFOKI_07265 [Sphingomonas qilianensis]|uniref:Baseplate protein J-like domain-containing protein n=1 Tax=Sphingomonas qilianensis TaxID=1736690 RepID=A0ABU9XQT8_9SPHN
MPIEVSIEFDRRKDFEPFFNNEPVGAVKWLDSLITTVRATGSLADSIASWLRPQVDAAAIASNRDVIVAVGKALTAPFASFSLDAVRAFGLEVSETPSPPMLRGTVQLVATTKELGQRLVLSVGQREFPLVSNDDPLECFAGDLSAFAGGAYEIAVVGWPDGTGQIHVQEAAPIMALPGLDWNDWAQGRLFDNGVVGGPVVLRVSSERQIAIDDAAMQERLRPFIGTGVVLYGKRATGDRAAVGLSALNEQLWFLTRLTNPADSAAGYPGAPRPAVIGDLCLCIGATPPWNWQGPNVETHIIAPVNAAALANTEERRVVFGKVVGSLPPGWPNPVAGINRVIEASACAEPPISTAAHIATRRAPRGTLIKTLRGTVELTSAERAFVS